MSNTSTSNDKAATDEKVKLIIGEIGRDTKTGIIGRGYSFDNGKTFHVTDTIYGRVFDENDADAAWNNGMHDKVKDKINQEIDNTVTPAIKQADEAVKTANDAIEKSKVNENSIREMNNAVSDAISDAAVARSDGLRAWDAAQSNVDLIDSNYASASAAISSARTEAIAAADEAKKSASAAQADIVAVRSDVAAVQADVTANKSDVAVAKSDIAVVKTDLASQATSLSSYASQASAAGQDITVLKSQAGQFEQDMADTKGDVSQLKVSASSASAALSDAAGNIFSLQASAKSYSAALSDTNSNVATVTATASELETKYADAAGDINQLQMDAKGTTQTLADAQGDIAKLKTRADGFDTEFADTNGNISKLQTDASGTKQTLTNAKSDIAVLQSRADGFDTKYADVAGDINTIKVNAKGMQQTLTNAKGDISTLQATATGFKNTLTDAQGNISTLQSDVAGLKKTTSDHAGNIATLQADAKTLTSQMADAQGDISTLQQTASGFSSRVSGMETSLANANSKIDGMKIGTRNLLHHSDTFDGWDKGNLVTITSDKYLNGTIAVLGNTGIDGGSQISTSLDSPYDNQPVTWTVYAKADNVGDKLHTELWGGGGYTDQPLTNNWQTYQFTGQRNTNNHTLYLWGCQGNKGNIYVALPFAVVGNMIGTWEPNPEDTDAKITTNSAAIDQNKKAIALKADQTTVDKTNGDVAQLKSQFKVQADQINSKVSSSDLDAKGYATQTYTQTLVTQKANEWNLNLTSLKTDVNAIKTTGGGVNLLQGTRDFSGTGIQGSKVAVTNGQDKFQAAYGTQNSSQTYFDLVCFNAIPLEKNTDYTASFWVKTSEDTEIRSFLFDSGSNGNYADGATVNHSTTDYTRIVVHFHNGNNNATPNFIPVRINKKSTITVWLYGCMLEEGTVAHAWSPAPSDMATVTSVTNLSATVDGIKGTVATKADQSEVTQLSNLVQTKVSSGDFTSTTTQLKNLINQRVQVGDVVSQINQEAGGNTLIQVSGGKGKLALNASSVVFSGNAFIPDAYISTLNADKLRFYDSSGNVATMSAGLEQYDDDKANKTIVLQYSGGYEVHASNLLGSILTMHDNTIRLAVKANGMSSSGSNDQYSGVYVMQHYAQLSNYRSDGKSPGIYITDDGFTILGDDSGVGTKWGDLKVTSPQLYLTGTNKCQINSANTQLTVANKWSTLHADGNLWLETNNAQIHLGDNVVDIANKNNSNTSNYDVHLTLRGYVNMTGWLTCMGLTQTSRLSTKTRIEPLDTAKALELINSADVATYQFKQEVAHGGTKRHASVIIDDVHDVAQYQTPDEFISEDRSGRSDGDIVGYLMGAVQELTKKIKTLESKVG